MTEELKKSMIEDLWNAMRNLYQARYKATGTETDHYADMDRQTFDEIAHIKTILQKTLSRLEK